MEISNYTIFERAHGFYIFVGFLMHLHGFVAHCYGGKKILVNEAFAPEQSALILIGPEGDFSENETSTAIKLGFTPLSLGNQRLRTETAGIAATAAFRYVNPA